MVRRWWKRRQARQWEDAVGQFAAGPTGEDLMLVNPDQAVQQGAFDINRRLWRRYTHATTRTGWRGD